MTITKVPQTISFPCCALINKSFSVKACDQIGINIGIGLLSCILYIYIKHYALSF